VSGHDDRRVAALASRQHGLVTGQQALAAGLTAAQIDRRVATGRWLVARRGVYVLAGVPPSQQLAVHAAVLAAGAGALASHATAAAIWQLGFPASDVLHVTTAPDRRITLGGVRHHRTASLASEDRTVRDGIPVTSPTRTIVDSSGAVGIGRLEEIVDDARRRRLVRPRDLAACIDRAATGPGRRPTLQIRSVASERLPIVTAPLTSACCATSSWPRPGPGPRARRRRSRPPVPHRHGWPWARTGLEFDGWAFHSSFRSLHRDRERLRLLAVAGWEIWPVTSRTVVRDLVDDLRRRLSGGFAGPTTADPPQSA
jgi:hypothetical protein